MKYLATIALIVIGFSCMADDLIILDDSAFRPVKNSINDAIQVTTTESGIQVDDPENPTGVFHGVFFIKCKLNKSQIFGDIIVDFYVKKGSDDWRKVAEIDPEVKPSNGDWNLMFYWNARKQSLDWNQTQPFKDNLKLKLKVRNK